MYNQEIQKIKIKQRKLINSLSNKDLIALYNREIGMSSSNWARINLLNNIHNAFKERGFDYSKIGNDDGLSFSKEVKCNFKDGKKIIKFI